MRVRALIFVIASLVLSACANSGNDGQETETTDISDTAGTTGYRKGVVPYVTNGDPRVEEALRQEREVVPTTPSAPDSETGKTVTPTTPVVPKPAAPTGNELRVQLKEFQITRYKLNEFKPSRFGDRRYSIIVFFRNGEQATFAGNFQGKDGNWKISATSRKYILTGKFTDTVPLKVDGELDLTDTKTKDTAKIFYSAYKAKLTVHEDKTKSIVAGSAFEKQLQSLRDHTFGWVHNWMVVKGPAFYLVDIVKQVPDGDTTTFLPPLMAFKGESLRTGDEDHPAESLTPKVSKDISLVGNSETSRRRWFQTKFEDPSSKEENDVILDFRAERAPKTGDKPAVDQNAGKPLPPLEEQDQDDDDDDVPAEMTQPPAQAPLGEETQIPPAASLPDRPANPAPQQQQQQQRPPPVTVRPPVQPPASTVQPSPVQPKPTVQPAPPAPLVSGAAYLKIDISLPRTARMTRDFARNRRIAGVTKWMNAYANAKDWHHRDLAAFYKYAFPFRQIIEVVGRAFDVSPSYAYLTVIESPYFTGGRYQITTENVSTAQGPFQLLIGTAKEQGMIVGNGANDERRFFATSACGAARYITKLVREFESSDSTVAILGYYQGDGGAARAIACTYADKSMCYGKNWSRYKQLAQNYNFTYAQIANVAAIPADQLDYVNKKLAIYFISEDISQYGFETTGVQSLPRNGSVFPNRQMNDPTCRQALAPMMTTGT